MRKFGYILLVFGFVWITFVSLEAVPVARALSVSHSHKVSEQQSYTRHDVELAFTEAAVTVAHFAMWGFFGGLLTLTGGIILAKSGKKDFATSKPPVP